MCFAGTAMGKPDPPVRWAPRVQPQKIRQLYALDARGIYDEALIDEVGAALYSRCLSIVHVSDAMIGKVHCPQCDTIIQRSRADAAAILQCPTCQWHAPWRNYHNTYRTQELGAGGARDMFEDFVKTWEHVRTPREKMLLIDQLLHRWHWETRAQRPAFGLGRPTGLNLIEGNKQQVLALLDSLTYGEGSTPGTKAAKTAWQQHRHESEERHAGNRTQRQAKARPRADTSEAQQRE